MTTPSTPQAQYGSVSAPEQQWQAQTGYVSPVPLRRATLKDALASEWTKIRSVRSTLWNFAVMLALVLGIGTLIALALSRRDMPPGESAVALGFVGVLLGIMPVMTLGVMTISSEYGTGMIRTTLTACPSRARVLGAKAIVFAALTFVVTLVATTLVSAVLLFSLGGRTTGALWGWATVGVSAYVALIGLFALAVGALLRHSAGAITLMIGFVLLPLVLALFLAASPMHGLQDFLLEYSIPSQLGVFYGTSMVQGAPGGWEALGIMGGLTAVFLGLAFFVQDRRDV
ncbi:ABC transporter [Streptomyces spiroverticillatus]|uniref:ABC transporter n=1 Tax=Streptomyces finlayi TaxID=67296 RepID=A0A918X4E8_9ACTN|nr:ABC transporter permease subunit [Streptomyces finlayi]GHA32301.1 ABC transporter [Streptomyces spiroverticillatus]GHD10659.1 ABC transporter [Streptomyces finlayi]